VKTIREKMFCVFFFLFLACHFSISFFSEATDFGGPGYSPLLCTDYFSMAGPKEYQQKERKRSW
jgi:hypothetical protein